MHEDIALSVCECMVGESTLRLMGSVNGTTFNRVARLNKMVKKICVGYQQEGIDPPSGVRPANYGQR